MGKRIQQVRLTDLKNEILYLGYVGENIHTQIVINCTEVFNDYPDAVASIVVKPPRGDIYLATISRNEDYLIWEVTRSDVAEAGNGKVQLSFVNDGEVIRSVIANTKIDASIEATGEAPAPIQNWIEQAEETAAQIAQGAARQAAVDVVEEAEAEIERVAGTIPADYSALSDQVSHQSDEIGDLKSAVTDPQKLIDSELPSEHINMLEVESRKSINRNTGEIIANGSYSVSGFIPVIPNVHYRGANINNFAWYDEAKVFISGGNPLNNVVSPETAKYLRVDFTTANIDNVHVYYGSLSQTIFNSSLQFKVNYPWLVHPIIDQSMIADVIFFNLYEKNNTADGRYLNETTGDVGIATSYSVSNYIRIKPSTSYTANYALRYAFYDANKNYISGANVSTQPATFTSPANAQFIALSINRYQKDSFVLCESAYYDANNVDHYQVILPWLRATKLSRFDGNTLVCFGDSITHMGYTGEIKKVTGMNAINVGLSSGRYAYTSDIVKDKFSFYRIAYAISTGDWTIPNSLQGETGYESVYSNIQLMQTIDFTNVQFVSIAYGTNDFSSGTALDNPDNPLDTSTFKGAIRYSLKLITEKYPNIKIMGVTPCYRFWSGNGVIIDDCDTHELYGHKLIDYVNAVKEVYTEYHLPVLDNLNNAGINQFNRLTYFGINDGLHPNQTGRNLIANRICDSLLANY